MNRRAILFHGTAAHPDVVWLPWLRERLTGRGYTVEAPHYPGLNVEPISTFLPKVLADHTFDADTVLVGHSGGAALLLAILEHIDMRVDRPPRRRLLTPPTPGRAWPRGRATTGGRPRERPRPATSSTPARPVRLRRRAGSRHVRTAGAPRSSATTTTSEISTSRSSRSSSTRVDRLTPAGGLSLARRGSAGHRSRLCVARHRRRARPHSPPWP